MTDLLATDDRPAPHCTLCKLHQQVRTVCVPDRGAPFADVEILLVGESPGFDEDKAGGPAFIGPAGQLLNHAAQQAGLPFDATHISNAVRCASMSAGRPSPPDAQCVAACLPYLQAAVLRMPKLKVIVPLGNVAAAAVLGRQVRITKERGLRASVALPDRNVAVIPSLHPSYVLRNSPGDPRVSPECAFLVADLKKALEIARPTASARPAVDYRLVNDVNTLKTFTEWLLTGHRLGKLPHGCIAVDVESDSLNPFRKNDHVASIQISWAEGKAVLIPVAHKDSAYTATIETADVLVRCVRAILAEIPVVGQTYRFDFKQLFQYLGAPTRHVRLDTALAHQHLRGGSEENGLKYMARKYLGMDAYEEEFQIAFEQYKGSCNIPMSTLLPYGCHDAAATLQIAMLLEDELKRTPVPPGFEGACNARTMYDSYVRLYGPTVWEAIVRMELHGIGVDMQKVADLSQKLPGILAAQLNVVMTSPFAAAWRERLKKPNEKRWRLVRGQTVYRMQCPSCSKIETSGASRRKCVCGHSMVFADKTTTYAVSEADCRAHPETYRWDAEEQRPRELDPEQPEFVYGEPNLASDDQLRCLVYEIMGCPPLESMKGKNPRLKEGEEQCDLVDPRIGKRCRLALSRDKKTNRAFPHKGWHQFGKRKTHTTESEVLERIADLAEQSKLEAHTAVLNAILNWTKVDTLKNRYVDGLDKILSNPADSRRDSRHQGAVFMGLGRAYPELTIHTTFGQFLITGRLGSSEPNMQNNPRGSETREMFVTRHRRRDGNRLVGLMGHCDYKQAELRGMCMLSRDAALAEALATSDPHLTTAVRIFGLPPEKVTSEKRVQAKAVSFGIPYGRGAAAIGIQIGKSTEEAQAILDEHKHAYPRTWEWIEEQHQFAHKHGYVVIPTGRVIPLPGIRGDQWEAAEAERYSVNYPIQGCQPGSVRVLTSSGMFRLDAAPRRGTVWTGTSWKPYELMPRGPWRRARVKLKNGHVIECDTRHSVLAERGSAAEFVHFDDLRIGDGVCMSMAQPLEFGAEFDVDEAYWMGFCIGNGCSTRRNSMSVTFGDRKLRYRRNDKAAEWIRWVESRGYRMQAPKTKPGCVSFAVEAAMFRARWEELGYPWGEKARTKRVPDVIWRSCLAARRAFLIGLLDADGCASASRVVLSMPSLHLCQRRLLEEVQTLARTVGVESIIRGPYGKTDSYRLDMNGGQLGALGYGPPRKTVVHGFWAPKRCLAEFLARVSPVGKDWSDSWKVLYYRARQTGRMNAYLMQAVLAHENVVLEEPLYAVSMVVGVEVLDFEEETYTLSVDDVGHRFDAEGVIHKNSMSDCGLIALGELSRLLVESYKSRLWCFTHDADDVDIEPTELFEIVPLVQRVMSEYPMSIFSWINLPMPVDFELGIDDSRRLSVKKIEGERGEGSLTLKGPAPFWKPMIERLEETYSVSVTDDKIVKRVEVPKKGKDSRSVVVSSLREDYDVIEGVFHLKIRR